MRFMLSRLKEFMSVVVSEIVVSLGLVISFLLNCRVDFVVALQIVRLT